MDPVVKKCTQMWSTSQSQIQLFLSELLQSFSFPGLIFLAILIIILWLLVEYLLVTFSGTYSLFSKFMFKLVYHLDWSSLNLQSRVFSTKFVLYVHYESALVCTYFDLLLEVCSFRQLTIQSLQYKKYISDLQITKVTRSHKSLYHPDSALEFGVL